MHIYRNIITRSLGSRPDVDVDTFSVPLQVDDAVLLCSDGLSNEVAPDDISRIVAGTENSGEAAALLVELANTHGGGDNVTALLIRVSDAVAEKSPLPWIAVGALLTVLVLGMLGLCRRADRWRRLPGAAVLHATQSAASPVTTGLAVLPAVSEVAPVPQRYRHRSSPRRQSRKPHRARQPCWRAKWSLPRRLRHSWRQEFRCERRAPRRYYRCSAGKSCPRCEIAPSENWFDSLLLV